MSAGDTAPGRRVEKVEPWDMKPGDYMLNGEGVVWVMLPNGVGPSLLTGWSVVEHEDGTITISPSILDHGSGWHGYLQHGAWLEV